MTAFLFLFSGVLAVAAGNAYPARPAQDPLFMLIGSAKETVGSAMFLKANSYFHGGEESEEEESEHHDHEHEEEKGDAIASLNRVLNAHEHRHLQGEESAEILPFLAVAVELDPHHVEAILSTAYWLDAQLKQTEEAVKVLRKGRAENPDSWQISKSLAKMLFHEKNYTEAAALFEEALKNCGSEPPRAEFTDMYVGLAEARRALGDKQGARKAYEAALAGYGPSENLPIVGILKEKIHEGE